TCETIQTLCGTSAVPGETYLAIPAQQMLLEQRIHGLQRLPHIVRAPGLPAPRFIFEGSVVVPFAFYLSLHRELLQLPEASRGIVTGIEKDDGCPELVDEINQ